MAYESKWRKHEKHTSTKYLVVVALGRDAQDGCNSHNDGVTPELINLNLAFNSLLALQCRNKVASHHVGRVVKVFKNNELIFPAL